jgi:FG-GAP repeat
VFCKTVGTAYGGAVSVLYGAAKGLTPAGGQILTGLRGPSGNFDQFGSALATGDFNDDGFADLAAGVPGQEASGIAYAGAVTVFYGTADGLTRAGGRLLTQDSPGVPDTAERGDLFGDALA